MPTKNKAAAIGEGGHAGPRTRRYRIAPGRACIHTIFIAYCLTHDTAVCHACQQACQHKQTPGMSRWLRRQLILLLKAVEGKLKLQLSKTDP